MRILPGSPTLESSWSSRLTSLRSFAVGIELDHHAGAEGILVSHGDQRGGYAVYVEGGRVRVAYNEYGVLHELDGGPLNPGVRRVDLCVNWRPALRVDVRVLVDNDETARLDGVRMLVGRALSSGIDVGVTRGEPVHRKLHARHGSFPYTGQLLATTWVPGQPAAYASGQVLAAEMGVALFYG